MPTVSWRLTTSRVALPVRGVYAWLIGSGWGPAHHLAQRHHRRAPSAAICRPLRARVRDLRWHGRDSAVRGRRRRSG